jgi:hypothetical protein
MEEMVANQEMEWRDGSHVKIEMVIKKPILQ